MESDTNKFVNEESSDVNVGLADEQIDALLVKRSTETKERGLASYSIGIVTFSLSLVDLIQKKIKVEVYLFAIPVGEMLLDSGSVTQRIGPNIGIAKATITLTVDWNRNSVIYVVKACIRNKLFNWRCTEHRGTLMDW